MHIAIDTTPLDSGHAHRGTGIYTSLLIESLNKYPSIHKFNLISKKSSIPKYDVLHYPFFDPFFLTLPLQKTVPTIVTVHDLIPIEYHNYFPVGIRGKVKWQIQKFSLASAAHIITDSYSSKNSIEKILPFTHAKISVIYLAPSELFYPVRNLHELSKVKNKYNLPKNYLLYVGDINWNKNIFGLLESFAQFSLQKKYSSFHLCLVGKAFINAYTKEAIAIQKYIRKLEIYNKVNLLGYVPDADLRSIYTLARCYMQVSFAEGFGLPVLEAMACGCPTVISNTSSLKEIAGPSVLTDPWNVQSITTGIVKALSKYATEKEKYVFIAWSKSYTWKQVAKQTIDVYEKVYTKQFQY